MVNKGWIALGVAVLLALGGFCLYWFVIRVKEPCSLQNPKPCTDKQLLDLTEKCLET